MNSPIHQNQDSHRELVKLTIVNAGFWFAWAMTTYLTVFLKSIGFTASQVGLMNALMAGAAIVARNGDFIMDSFDVLAPLELKATAQAIYASVVSAASIVGNLLGGILFDHLGAQTFYITAAIIFVVSAGLSWGSSFLKTQKQ